MATIARVKEEMKSAAISSIENKYMYVMEGPMCVLALEAGGAKVQEINATGARMLSPLFKLADVDFRSLATEGESHKQRLSNAIQAVATSDCGSASARARNIEMLTLAESNSGLPIKKHFDWVVGKGKDGTLLLFGDPCSEQDTEQRAKDSELVDFFQNAPIALHWLSGDGIVLWANQRELDVLGYTAEEYIGQPIMKFCPDEEELVLEIFKQLGSGNAIKDVPVRFRTKDGRIVDLLIDSNVKYDTQGNFSHTRCFIRDDTKRKIREARAQLLLEETKRSLKMLDNMMSRSMHHMRTPLHVLQASIDLIAENLQTLSKRGSVMSDRVATDKLQESESLLAQASDHVTDAVSLIDDIADLARLDQGQELNLTSELVQLKDLSREALEALELPSQMELALDLKGGGPPYIHCDARSLKKVIGHLLTHLVNDSQSQRSQTVTLVVGHENDRCIFTLLIEEEASPSKGGLDFVQLEDATNQLPPIFHRYSKELLPEEMDFEACGSLRNRIEKGLNSHRETSTGVGLGLSYHLVSALGGDLRYMSAKGIKKFWFSLPHNNDNQLSAERIVIGSRKRKFTAAVEEKKVVAKKSDIASQGLQAQDPPSVLVVEDVSSCAKLLCAGLRRANCASKWVSNGKEAIEELKSSKPGTYSLILMDLRMPVMDGLTATRIIKQELHLDTPVVALTGETGDEIKEQCKKIGFDEYCSKPMKVKLLKEVVGRFTHHPQ